MMDPPYNGPGMEARTTAGSGVRRAPNLDSLTKDPRLAKDPFFYGYRWVQVKTPEGKTVSEQVPLTPADLLDPQEDDKVANRLFHDLTTGRIGEILRTLFTFREREDVVVMCDVKMLWKDPKIHRVAPDLSVVPHVREAVGRDFSSFDQAKEGTRPVFVMEVTSEATENTDQNRKPAVYQQAQVEEYFILDQLESPWKLVARRLNPATGRYRKLRPDKDGRVAAETLEVLFEIGEDGKSLVLTDMRTGEPLRDHLGEAEARHVEAEARRAAEEKYRAEAEARRAAEEKIQRLEALLAQKNDA